jgi:hypothetical protein
MKKTVFFGLLVIILAFGFIGCDSDTDDSPTVLTYEGNIDGKPFVLKITNNSSFEFTVDGKTSKGTALKVGDNWSFTSSSGDTFTVTITSSGVTGISGTITFEDGGEMSGTFTVTQTLSGTYSRTTQGIVLTFTFSDNSVVFVIKDDKTETINATYSLSGSTITFHFDVNDNVPIETATLSNDRKSFTISGITDSMVTFLNGTYRK